MRYRLIFSILLLATTTSCIGGGELSNLKYKTTKVDTTDMYFTGEYYLNEDMAYFKDCATSKIMNLHSSNFEKIKDLYITAAKGDPTFCTFRGYYNARNSVITVKEFIGFNIEDVCMPVKLNKTYAWQGDTLTLTNDYKYTLKAEKSKELKGNWARVYRDSGVLLMDNGNGIMFTINAGLKYDNNNLFLSMNGVNGKGVVFLPIKIN